MKNIRRRLLAVLLALVMLGSLGVGALAGDEAIDASETDAVEASDTDAAPSAEPETASAEPEAALKAPEADLEAPELELEPVPASAHAPAPEPEPALDGKFGENARLKIGGEEVDPNSPAEGTGWSYDGAGKLTLTSATITGNDVYAIIAMYMDLTIVLSGNNVVNSAKYGIRLDYGNLTITGGGSLTAESDNHYAITTVKGGLTIDGCTVSASCTGDNSYYAVESDGYLTIRNSTVTCSSTNFPICAAGILTITGSSTVEATGKNAIESFDGGLSIGEGLAITEPFGGVNTGNNVKLNGKNVEHVLIEPGYTVSVSASEGGTASGGGGYKKDTDATATVTATAESGYLFVNWTENGEEVSTNPEYSFKVTGSRDLVANFEEVVSNYTVTNKVSGAPADGSAYKLGEKVAYKIKVENDGNLTIVDIKVKCDLTGDEWTIDSLAPAESREFDVSHTVTEADILNGKVIGEATTDGSSAKLEAPNGSLTVEKKTTSKPENGSAYAVGEEIAYAITVKNNGNLTITDITVTDDKTGDNWSIASMKPGGSTSFTPSYTVVKADSQSGQVKNTATATGKSPDTKNPEVTASDYEVDPVELPTLYTVTGVGCNVYDDSNAAASSAHEDDAMTAEPDIASVPEGKYVTNLVSAEAELTRDGPALWSFTMPAKNVTVTAQYADQKPYTIDLKSGSAAVPAEVAFSLYAPGTDDDFDLDGDGADDVHIVWAGYGEATVTALAGTNIETTYVQKTTAVEYGPVTYLFGDEPYYTVVSGGDGEWTKGSKDGPEIVVKRSVNDGKTYSLFMELQVDGTVVDPANYKTAEGSLKLTFKTEYLKTLKAGKHDVKIVFADGEAETTLTVKAKSSGSTDKTSDKSTRSSRSRAPKTGDETSIVPWTLLFGASAMGFGIVVTKKRREKFNT